MVLLNLIYLHNPDELLKWFSAIDRCSFVFVYCVWKKLWWQRGNNPSFYFSVDSFLFHSLNQWFLWCFTFSCSVGSHLFLTRVVGFVFNIHLVCLSFFLWHDNNCYTRDVVELFMQTINCWLIFCSNGLAWNV